MWEGSHGENTVDYTRFLNDVIYCGICEMFSFESWNFIVRLYIAWVLWVSKNLVHATAIAAIKRFIT